MPKTTPKTTAKTKTSKKSTSQKTLAKKKITITEPFTKSQTFTYLAETAGLRKKDIAHVMEALASLIALHLGSKKGPGEFVVPGLMKCRVVRKPATKARPGINPFTKQETIFKAKPAHNVVKIKPLKKLKDMVE
jgi:nucleoid DNA-binding protein